MGIRRGRALGCTRAKLLRKALGSATVAGPGVGIDGDNRGGAFGDIGAAAGVLELQHERIDSPDRLPRGARPRATRLPQGCAVHERRPVLQARGELRYDQRAHERRRGGFPEEPRGYAVSRQSCRKPCLGTEISRWLQPQTIATP